LVAAQPLLASGAGTPPTVDLVTAPDPGAIVPYHVSFSWQGSDADGVVTLYRFAIDPPAVGDTIWIGTNNTQQLFFFQARTPDLPIPVSGPVTFSEPHTFVIEAVDDEGLESPRVSRAFFASTIAPEVQIVSPAPNAGGAVGIGSDVVVEWQGTDSDGLFSHIPVQYKYLLIGQANTIPGGIDAVWANPDLLRTLDAPGFVDWTTTSRDTTSVHVTNLLPNARYLFCVVAFDEAGAYSARFARAINMIQMIVGATPTRAHTWGRLKTVYREPAPAGTRPLRIER
jgi:hypothetical protein